jgi:signal peptidase II
MGEQTSHADLRLRVGLCALAAVLLVLDRVTKIAIAAAMPLYDSKPIIGGFFDLVHTRNTGIAFSLLNDAGPLVKDILIPMFSLVAVSLVVYLLWKSGPATRRMQFGLTLILAGAAGNLYDRFAYGYVVDFLDFYIGAYHWPAFNVADSCITVGAGLLLLDSVLGSARAPRREPESV